MNNVKRIEVHIDSSGEIRVTSESASIREEPALCRSAADGHAPTKDASSAASALAEVDRHDEASGIWARISQLSRSRFASWIGSAIVSSLLKWLLNSIG